MLIFLENCNQLMADPEKSVHPLERYYGYQVTRRLHTPSEAPSTPPPDVSGRRDATRADVENWQNLLYGEDRPGQRGR